VTEVYAGEAFAVEGLEKGAGFGAKGLVGFGAGEEGVAIGLGKSLDLFTKILNAEPALVGSHKRIGRGDGEKTSNGVRRSWRIVETGEEPGAGEAHFAVDAGAGNAEELCGFFDAAAEKEAEFNHAGLFGVEGFEFGDGAVEIEHGGAGGIDPWHLLMKGDGLCAVSALAGSRRASVIDESQTHKLFVESLEVGAAFKAGFAPGLIFKEELIEQPGGLQELPFSLATKIGSGNGVQLWIDERRETVEGGEIATAPLVKQQGDVGVAHETVHLRFTVLKTV